jgi:hypothetical protein
MANNNENVASGSKSKVEEVASEPAPIVTVPQPTVAPSSGNNEGDTGSGSNSKGKEMVTGRAPTVTLPLPTVVPLSCNNAGSGSSSKGMEVLTESAHRVTVPQPTVVSTLGNNEGDRGSGSSRKRKEVVTEPVPAVPHSSSKNQRMLNTFANWRRLIRPEQQPHFGNIIHGNNQNTSTTQSLGSHVDNLQNTSLGTIGQDEANRNVSDSEDEDKDADMAESAPADNVREGFVRLVCRVCESQAARVVLSPCYHLCVCKPCSEGLTSCPVCQGEILDTIEPIFPTD